MRQARVAAVVAAVCGVICSRAEGSTPRSAAEERARRLTPIATIAPAPEPWSPLRGEDGVDSAGYPRRHVDRAALRALLVHRRFQELTTHVERLQAEFEADPRKEYWPSDAGDALGTAEPGLLPLLDAWVEASPASFAPYLARGTHWVSVAYQRRGTKWTQDTPDEDFEAMEAAIPGAAADLERALALRPTLVAAIRKQIQLDTVSGSRSIRSAKLVSRALELCPPCFQIRVAYLFSMTPRWGGSYEQMREFIRTRSDPTNPRMAVLPGYLDLDASRLLEDEGAHGAAMAAIGRACALGDASEFLIQRADLKLRNKQVASALADLDRAEAVRPGLPDVRAYRARAHGLAGRWEEAGRQLRAAVQLDPTNTRARSDADWIVKGLVWEADQRLRAGRRAEALSELDVAAELAPDDRWVKRLRITAITSDAEGDDAVGVLERQARSSPDDFRTVQKLDYALARRGAFERIVRLWSDYLARHPGDGRAYLERGGALFHLRRIEESRADARRACARGVSEGCVRADQLPR